MTLTRDQERAEHAYTRVKTVGEAALADYKIAVNGLGPNVIRSGLAGALAFLQRSRSDAAEDFGRDLALGLPTELEMGQSLEQLALKVFAADVATYMLVTRECLKLAVWFKRAVQARGTAPGAGDRGGSQ